MNKYPHAILLILLGLLLAVVFSLAVSGYKAQMAKSPHVLPDLRYN